MSGSGKDDLLDRLLRSVHQSGRVEDSSALDTGPAVEEPASSKGLNPLTLLGLPTAQRDCINWLSRRKQARFEEIQEALNVEGVQLAEVIAALKAARHIQEALIDGEIYYRVVFAGKVSRAARGLPSNIWDRVDLDNSVFLRQVPLFRGLSDDNRREIAERLESRRYRRNEVIFWQGGLGEGIYFIKSGIVGITRLTPGTRDNQILTYLKQGDLVGEYGLLFDQNMAASGTATALSEVDLLLMKREQMLEMLKRYPSTAVELVQMLAQRLLLHNAQTQPARLEKMANLCLIFGAGPKVGMTTIGSALAMSLARDTQNPTVYTEYPAASQLPVLFDFPADAESHTLPGGYDIAAPRRLSAVPPSVRTTLLLDRLTNAYANVVIGISAAVDESVIYMLERADQVIVITSPDQTTWTHFETLRENLKALIRSDTTNLCLVCNRPNEPLRGQSSPGAVDVDIPWFETLPPLWQRKHDNLPDALVQLSTLLADRLGRTNQIGLFIPAVLDTNPALDTKTYAEKAVSFLGSLFGTTSNYPSYSLSSSGQSGAAAEKFFVVQTHVTKSDIDRRLGDVLTFVEKLKTDLGQEVMALEVNHNVMLV